MNSPLIPRGSAAYQSLSKGEKVLHSFDSIINARENSLAKQGMIRDFKKIANTEPHGAKFKMSDYKDRARAATRGSLSSQRQHLEALQSSNFQRPKTFATGARKSTGIATNNSNVGSRGREFNGFKLKNFNKSTTNNQSARP